MLDGGASPGVALALGLGAAQRTTGVVEAPPTAATVEVLDAHLEQTLQQIVKPLDPSASRVDHVSDLIALLLAAVLSTLYFGLGPSTGRVAFVLQMGGIGAAVGLVIGLYRAERDGGFPMQLLVSRWSVFGLAVGLVIALIDAVL